jgi:hypothetical protein
MKIGEGDDKYNRDKQAHSVIVPRPRHLKPRFLSNLRFKLSWKQDVMINSGQHLERVRNPTLQ